MKRCILWLDSQGPRDPVGRRHMRAFLMINQAEKIQRVGIIGFLFDESLAEVLRAFMVSRLILAGGLG